MKNSYTYLQLAGFIILGTEDPSLDTEECVESDIKNMPARQGLLFGCFCPIVLTHEICQNYITAISMNVEYYGGSCAKRCFGGKNIYAAAICEWHLTFLLDLCPKLGPSQDSMGIVGIRQEKWK